MKNLFLIILLISQNVYSQEVKGDSLKMNISIFFDTDSFNINNWQLLSLKRLINNKDSLKLSKIQIYSYCDDRKSTEYNMILSNKRSNAIFKSLENLVYQDSVSFEIKNFGKIPLISRDSIALQRAQNRRVDVTVTFFKVIKEKIQEDATVFKKIDFLENKEVTLEKMKVKKTVFNIFGVNPKVGDKITLKKILFVEGRSVIKNESLPVLNNLLESLKAQKYYSVKILGHVCCVPKGQDAEDFATGIFNLSEVRAKAIYDYLITHGIEENRLNYAGMKSNFPLGKGEKNDRRVELEIMEIRAEK